MASEQTEVSPCCVTGHIHSGTPLGSNQILHGLNTYVSNSKPPTEAGAKQNVVILLHDIFGADLVNTKLVADEYAGRGWKVLLPDVFEGDAVDIANLNAIVPNNKYADESTVATKAADGVKAAAALGPWLIKHREAVSRPLIENFVAGVRADPSTGKIAAVGYCWGGRYVALLAHDDSPARIDVGVSTHPSFMVADDLKPITKVPIAIYKGGKDAMVTDDGLKEFEGILREQLGDKVETKIYPKGVHGFAVRGDMEDPTEKAEKEEVTKDSLDFIAKYFNQ
ncbi:hypothetical protein CI109_107027 [Kwoniella shandongensis]|uniref:Dienelactone hydrolase domain-containing protein n=1 Tax=Kwoniella shandongensis TaxID=1734106 RepID=A0A5M6BRK4_9TREE|nr:uncharacterized protein CI109_007437 [Kwoniella shandongensis]KAA5524225.1 hypothetical protein CI109_007437 [Kwoniella shandongensis]